MKKIKSKTLDDKVISCISDGIVSIMSDSMNQEMYRNSMRLWYQMHVQINHVMLQATTTVNGRQPSVGRSWIR
jgi:hypothetical protein